LKADRLDFKTDSLVFFLQKKAFLIKKSALLTQYVVKTFKFSPYMIKKNLQGDGRELLCHVSHVMYLMSCISCISWDLRPGAAGSCDGRGRKLVRYPADGDGAVTLEVNSLN